MGGRRLVAALACRNTGSRLYGKPLQKIDETRTILDQIIESLKRMPMIDEIVLGISEGTANLTFIEVAHAHAVSYVLGDPNDVLMRLIQCGRAGAATDVFRVTTECPWFAYRMLPAVWAHHVASGNDISVSDRLPEGLNFEIYSLAALERAHRLGNALDRSEYCSNYPRAHPEDFKATVFFPPKQLQRVDLRVTVDYPEDLIVAREITRHCASAMPLVSVRDIVSCLDANDAIRGLVSAYVDPQSLWQVFKETIELDCDV